MNFLPGNLLTSAWWYLMLNTDQLARATYQISFQFLAEFCSKHHAPAWQFLIHSEEIQF